MMRAFTLHKTRTGTRSTPPVEQRNMSTKRFAVHLVQISVKIQGSPFRVKDMKGIVHGIIEDTWLLLETHQMRHFKHVHLLVETDVPFQKCNILRGFHPIISAEDLVKRFVKSPPFSDVDEKSASRIVFFFLLSFSSFGSIYSTKFYLLCNFQPGCIGSISFTSYIAVSFSIYPLFFLPPFHISLIIIVRYSGSDKILFMFQFCRKKTIT